MSPSRTRSSQFGGMVGITAFGRKAIEAFIILIAPNYWVKWEKSLADLPIDSEDGFEIRQCQTALLVS